MEHATTVDGKHIHTDCCYGCRNRYFDVRKRLELAAAALGDARELCGTDRIGQEAKARLEQIESDLTDTRRWIDEPGESRELIAGVNDALAGLTIRADD